MKNKLFISILGMMMLLSMFTLVSAQPSFETNVNTIEGLQIFYPQITVIKQNAEFSLHLHVSNISNGYPLLNTQVDCRLHLYDNTGNHTFESDVLNKDSNGYDHEIFISSGNFSRLGEHAFYIFCNNSNLGGEARGTFEVNLTGTELTTSQSILYGVIFVLLGLFLFFSIYEIKNVISVEWLIGYICLSYLVLYSLISMLWILSMNYLIAIPIFESILLIVWITMGIGFLPFIIIISMYILGKEARSMMEQNYINQGYSRNEAKELSHKNKR